MLSIFLDFEKKGLPFLSFKISMSLKFKLSLKPLPRDLAKDSLAANLLEKKLVLKAF